jgi:hypothetical protein
MLRLRLAFIALFLMPLAALAAESVELKLPNFQQLEKKAVDSVDVTVGAWPFKLAAKFMDDDDPESKDMHDIFVGIKSVYVRSFRFDSDFVYSEADVDSVRAQLTAPTWSRLVQTRERRNHEAVDIYVATEGDHARAIAIVASKPRELTIVNIVGRIDLDKVARLQSHLGLRGLKNLEGLADVETDGHSD